MSIRVAALVSALALTPASLAFAQYRPYQSEAYGQGLERGIRAGEEDSRRGQSFQFTDESDYRSADAGYRSQYGPRELYRDEFRRGYEAGYRTGYSRYARGPNQNDPWYGDPAAAIRATRRRPTTRVSRTAARIRAISPSRTATTTATSAAWTTATISAASIRSARAAIAAAITATTGATVRRTSTRCGIASRSGAGTSAGTTTGGATTASASSVVAVLTPRSSWKPEVRSQKLELAGG